MCQPMVTYLCTSALLTVCLSMDECRCHHIGFQDGKSAMWPLAKFLWALDNLFADNLSRRLVNGTSGQRILTNSHIAVLSPIMVVNGFVQP